MGSHFENAGTFLISTLFSLYILALMLRFLFQWVRADFSNPISQFIYKVTNPPLIPLRRIIPGYRGFDFSAIVLLIILQSAEFFIIGLLPGKAIPAFVGLIPWAIAELVSVWINIYIFGIIILAIISWINPMGYNPIISLLGQVINPVMQPVRRLIPPTSGLDLSPMIALITLIFIKLAFVDYLIFLFKKLAFPYANTLFFN
ncbi:YggT family protein [Beggiatoa alba]|nr:YggT family protein [Beggiatoa alba]